MGFEFGSFIFSIGLGSFYGFEGSFLEVSFVVVRFMLVGYIFLGLEFC